MPESTEWMCGKAGHMASNPFDAGTLSVRYSWPYWLAMSVFVSLLAVQFGKISTRTAATLLCCGGLMNVFMAFGVGWMSDRYELAASVQCGYYG